MICDVVTTGRQLDTCLGDCLDRSHRLRPIRPPERVCQHFWLASIGRSHIVDRMFSGLTKQKCPVLTLLSGDDLTAMEFQQLCRQDRAWRKLVGSWKQVDFPQADHTFSDPTQFANHNQVITDWLSSLKLNEG